MLNAENKQYDVTKMRFSAGTCFSAGTSPPHNGSKVENLNLFCPLTLMGCTKT